MILLLFSHLVFCGENMEQFIELEPKKKRTMSLLEIYSIHFFSFSNCGENMAECITLEPRK